MGPAQVAEANRRLKLIQAYEAAAAIGRQRFGADRPALASPIPAGRGDAG